MDLQDYLHRSSSNAVTALETVFNSRSALTKSLLEQHERMRRLTMGIHEVLAPKLSALEALHRIEMTELAAAIDAKIRATTFPRIGSALEQVYAAGSVLANLERTLQPFQQFRTIWDGFTVPAFPPLKEFEPLCNFFLEHSWYVTTEAPLDFLLGLSELLNDGETAKIEAELAQFIRGRLDEIEEALTTRFPHREHLLRPAFRAHRNGEFALSIPALLAQADGISSELWQEPFFCSKKSMAALKALFAQSLLDAQVDPWLANLLATGRMRARTSTLVPTDDTINRHAVLHGLQTNWNTEINSLKCIALIDFFPSMEWTLQVDAQSAAAPAILTA